MCITSGMLAKYEQLQGATKNPFIDPDGCRAYVDLKAITFRKTLAEQQAEKALESPKSQR